MADPRPRRPSVHPPQRGGGCRAVRTRRPALRGQTGDPICARASAPERGRGGGHGRSPSFSMRRLRRWTGAGETGKGPGRGGPRKRDTLGRGPREQQTGSGLRRTEKRTQAICLPKIQCNLVVGRHLEFNRTKIIFQSYFLEIWT